MKPCEILRCVVNKETHVVLEVSSTTWIISNCVWLLVRLTLQTISYSIECTTHCITLHGSVDCFFPVAFVETIHAIELERSSAVRTTLRTSIKDSENQFPRTQKISFLCVSSVCFICVIHLCVSSVCFITVFHLCVSSVCFICVCHLRVSSVCFICVFHLCVSSVWHRKPDSWDTENQFPRTQRISFPGHRKSVS